MLRDLSRWVDEGVVECHLTRRCRLCVEGLREAHAVVEDDGGIGKVGVGVDVLGEDARFKGIP